MSRFTVAAVQVGAVLGNVERNVASVVEGIRSAKADGAALAVFPETILSGYMFHDAASVAKASVSLDGSEVGKIVTACAHEDMFAVVGLLESDAGHVYNTAVLFGPDGIVGKYRKIHLPYLGLDRFVTPGEIGEPAVFSTRLGRIGLAICYDIRFPESARCLALAGADLIAQPSVWPESVDLVANHMVRVRAAENHVYMVAVTRGDAEDGVQLRGNSQVIDPRGRELAMAGKGDARLLCEIDVDFARQKDLVFEPGVYEISLFSDRAPRAYAAIVQERAQGDSRRRRNSI